MKPYAEQLQQGYEEQLGRANRLHAAADEVVADLCALAEEQPGNPHDELSARLYEIAHKLELAQLEPIHV